MEEEIYLVYMLAGLSKRFGGKPKGLVKIGPQGETLLEYSLNQALSSNPSKIIFIVSKETEKPFKTKFGNQYKGIPILYTIQTYNKKERDKPWGTADAPCSASHLINKKFILCNGDDIYGEEAFRILAEHLRGNSECATVGYKLKQVLSKNSKVNRGIFEINLNNTVKTITETPEITMDNYSSKGLTENTLCNMNILALNPNTLNHLKQALEQFKKENINSRTAECYITTEIGKLIKQNKISLKLYTTNSKWFGLTNPEDEESVKEQLKTMN